MSIRENLVKVKKHPKNYIHYSGKYSEETGCYLVPVSSLSVGSKVLVTRICDNCAQELLRPYKDVLRYRKDGKDLCFTCGNNSIEALSNKSNSHRGYKWSNDSKIKSSIKHTGMKHSEETKAKIKFSVSETTSSSEWKQWIKKHNDENYSLDAYIRKYGSDGENFYKIERKSKMPRCLEYWLVKYGGDIDLAVKALSEYQRRDLKIFVNTYGEVEGKKKYDDWNIKKLYNNKAKYSKSSQRFIFEVIAFCDLDNTSLYHGDDEWIFYLLDEERKIFNNEKQIVSVDFFDRKNKLIIEYDGDYWHSSEKQIFYDNAQDTVLKDRGFKVFRIKENEYLSDKNKFLVEVRKFYESIKY